jgi:DNA-binding NarL/FixJ family response regulator
MTIRVLLTDDHQRMRDGLRALIDRQPGMAEVAEALNGQSTVELACRLKPDVIIMDINMPDVNGIDATSRIMTDCPAARVIGLSMYADSQFVTGMLKAGASGYMLKDCAFEELARAIRIVVADRIYLGSGIAAVEGFAAPEAG